MRSHRRRSGSKTGARRFITIRSIPSYMTGRYFPVPCRSVQIWRQLFKKISSPEEQLLPHILSESEYEAVMVSARPSIRPESRLSRALRYL